MRVESQKDNGEREDQFGEVGEMRLRAVGFEVEVGGGCRFAPRQERTDGSSRLLGFAWPVVAVAVADTGEWEGNGRVRD